MEEVGILREQGACEGFDMKSDNGAQAETLTGIGPEGFHHFGETTGHFTGVVHFIQITHDRDFDAAAQGLNEVTGQAGATAAESVNNADAGFDTGGDALPFDGVVEETVAIVQRHIERSLSLAFFAGKKVLRSGFEILGPEEAGPLGFQTQNALKGVGCQPGERGEGGGECADEGVLVLNLGEQQVRSQLSSVGGLRVQSR